MPRTRHASVVLSSARRRGVGVAAVLVALPVLVGCGGGFNATTTKPYAPSDGQLANSGNLRVQNILVVAADGSTTGVVSGAIANRGNARDQLVSMTSADGAVALTGNGALPANASVLMGSGTPLAATITNLTVKPGATVRLRLTFAHANPLTIDTLVLPQTGYYASITPSPAPSPSAT